MDQRDETSLRRAIRLAMNGRGKVEPNPMVGCVIVKNDRVIGEGFHARFGEAHAEPNALASCTESPRGATAYVTLEPCCHTNKKTPPCVPRLIAAGIARVVVGTLDPNEDVDGKGIAMLREAGIEVVGPSLEAEAKQLIAPFVGRTKFHRPYITLKWAQSADGKVSGPGGARAQISNPASSRLVHTLRARSDAVLVGVNTVLADDPLLTARNTDEERRDAMRLVLDSTLRTPVDSQLARSTGQGAVEVFFTKQGFASAEGPDRVKRLMAAGVGLSMVDENESGRISIPKLLSRDVFEQFTHLLVEPGPTLAHSFFDAGAADRVWVIQSPKRIDAADALNAPRVPRRYVKSGELQVEGDTIVEYLDPESDLFFANVPSADLVLANQ
ncbi:MAG TPA: bifunctional diaminohydroxyphosphoribosylaminopyrimidine deaminase/5-amino-6-(5-phosphoribosylamino)uracil reductase RibD [Tepidisphaeraceae bacterium]|jgi:diaminohydroxyphosphoribosylaminopyrimidine deaminase/5-amino-6-(5-phosphoribosylamino)uracil reductase|nr:bifunctional diaminohydroxyphosphoribosylaminopyrimidine deaminase/5-amino-6-(5-phosphoribosylamino)uracil reductase RibD [Tepidisphaeraceae bacterium]